jgi:energy-coupling factor transport system substrate-specific component
MKSDKLTSRDLITVAIFTVVFTLIMFVCSMTLGMAPLGYPFLIAIAIIPGGIVWVYMRVKVPKSFAITIQCVVFALLMFIAGSGWFIMLGIVVGGVLADLISGTKQYKGFARNTVGYAVFGSCVNLGLFSLVILARDYYYDYCLQGGMEAEWLDKFMGFMSLPMLLLTCGLTVIGAILGMLLGRALLKKHFLKAGIV